MRNRAAQREPGARFGDVDPIASGWHDAHWDPLLVCVSVFVLTSVGRIHQLFPALLPLRPTLVAGALSIALYVIDSTRARRLRTIGSRTTTWALALLLWVVLSVPGSLWPGGSFELLTDDFMKTVLMYLVIVGAVRGPRDVERLAFVYFAAAVVFASVGLARFGAASGGRLDHLPYYDANDFGVFAVTALPLGGYFIFSQRRLTLRLAACAGLVPLLYAFVQAGSRGGLLAFSEHRDEWEKLRDRPELMPDAVEEILRWASPISHFTRIATEDAEVRGVTIPAGEQVALYFASANRDEDVFEDPLAFRVDRRPNPHLAFGFGEHFCMGAHLARVEIEVMYSHLLDRLASFEVSGPVERLSSITNGSIKRLPIRFAPA